MDFFNSFFHQVHVDHGSFYSNFIPIHEASPSEATNYLCQDYSPYHHSVWIGSLCKQL